MDQDYGGQAVFGTAPQGHFTPSFSPAPGLHGHPPGMGPPGMAGPPGMQMQGPPGIYPSATPQNNFQHFQATPLVPGIDMNATVIRMGNMQGGGRPGFGDGMGGARRGAGLGFDGRDRRDAQLREPTEEEIKRTLMVMDITPGCRGDNGLERILSVGGGLRSFIRVTDEDYKPTTMGFAEYEDVDSFHRATEILKDVWVPRELPTKTESDMLAKKEDETDGHPTSDDTKAKLTIIIDPESLAYVENWRSRGSMEDPEKAQFRIDSAKEDLSRILHHMCYVADVLANGEYGETTADNNSVPVVNVPVAAQEDELSDIPEAMREIVAKEIANFRNRSVLRELERAKREEEMEAVEKRRGVVNRLSSPPKGPRAEHQGVQIPRDYKNGVTFVGDSDSLANLTDKIEDDDTDANDSELEGRRTAKEEEEHEKEYQIALKKWEAREQKRAGALEGQLKRDQEIEAKEKREKEAIAKRLKEWNDDTEIARGTEEYYTDRSGWIRKRAIFRAREVPADDYSREIETRELEAERQTRNHDADMADQFLEDQAQELDLGRPAKEPAKFTMSLGAAANRAQAASAPRRTLADVEGLLEDEEEEETHTTKRTLRPLADLDTAMKGVDMTPEERAEATRELAKDIPTDKDGLWNWPVQWKYVDEHLIKEQLRPFVERKIMDYLGVQEDMLVDLVEDAIRKNMTADDLVGELEGALDDEAEAMVKKLWRMIIFFTESERRGLGDLAK